MKKIVYAFAAIIAVLGFTSCNDNDSLPDVDFKVSIANGRFENNDIYVVQGDTLSVESVQVVNNEQGKAVTVPYVNYYFNYQFVGRNVMEPYGFNIVIPESLPIGKYTLELTAPVFAVDKEPGYAVMTYNVKVVASADEIPTDGAVSSQLTAHVTENGD